MNKTTSQSPNRDLIAARYAAALAVSSGDTEVREFHYTFADAILNRDAWGLKYLANGLNDTGKRVFSDITGVALPRSQRDTWATIKRYCGLSDAEEAKVNAARAARQAADAQARHVRFCAQAAERIQMAGFGVSGKAWVERCIADGFTDLVAVKRGAATEYYLRRPGDTQGFHLTQRGRNGAALWRYAQALLAATPVPATAAAA